MSGLIDRLFGGRQQAAANDSMPNNIEAPDFALSQFGRKMLISMYDKIMGEAADRASLPAGVTKEAYGLTMNNSASPAKRGLLALVVKGMVDRDKQFYRVEKTNRGDLLFIKVYGLEAMDAAGNVKPGIMEIDLTWFEEGETLAQLFEVMGLIAQSVGNATAVSQAAIIKIHELSQMIANDQNLEPLTAQLKHLNEAISKGRAGVIDAQSSIEFAQVDTKPGSDAAAFIYSMVSTITGIPASYLFGEVAGGLGDQSTGDEKRMDKAIRRYFDDILSGILYAAWGKAFTYKKLVVNLAELVELFTFLETTTMITPEGKARILLDNTNLEEDEIDTSEPEPEPMPAPGEVLPPEQQQAIEGQ